MNLKSGCLQSCHLAYKLPSRVAALVKSEAQHRILCHVLAIGLLFFACCCSHADNPPTFVGSNFPQEKPEGTHSYIKTSDNKILLDGVDNALIGETNYPGSLSAFPGKKIDVLMQQCFGGGFAKGMQQFLDEYTFSAATNWNEMAHNNWVEQEPASLRNFTASWVQGMPRGEKMYHQFANAVYGAAADGPKPAVKPDPYGPAGNLRKLTTGSFENPTFASPDPAHFPGRVDLQGPNNGRQLTLDNNQWAILMATQPNHRRFSTNIKRVYDALRVGVPANQIIVLYGDSAANTTTPDGTPINGPMTRNNFFSATSRGPAGKLFGSIRGLGEQGIPDQIIATPGENSRLFVYNTGHGSSFTLDGARRMDTLEDNRARFRVDAMPGNGFVNADGDAPSDGDTTSFVGLQFSTQAPLNPGVTVAINGTGIGSLFDDNMSPATDLTPFLGNLYNYSIDVPLSFFHSFPIGSPFDIELDNLVSAYDSLVSAITFNNYGDAWSVSVKSIPEPSHIALLVSGLMTICVFQRRH